jgi:hypothetical protein
LCLKKVRADPVFLFPEKEDGMKLRDRYGWEKPVYAMLRDKARNVVAAYQNAARHLDALQEYVYIEVGLVHTARAIHDLAHEMPKRFDAFGEMLHENHLMTEYPATNEYPNQYEDMDEVFDNVMVVLDEIQMALFAFREAAEADARTLPMALVTEELMMQNSQSRTRFNEMWAMYDDASVSATSFDNWVKGLNAEENDE